MLIVENLVKTFKHAKEPTLKGVSFTVNDGEVLGLVGKNGAGKSTTIKSIIGIFPFEEGKITINGFDIKKDENEAKALIGYVPDNHNVYESLTGREYLNFIADVYQVEEEKRVELINKYAKIFHIDHALDRQISGYSHGMHQKICIMGALIHEPELWVLDEPFLGLDPQSIRAVKKCIIEYSKKEGHMVIFSSHNLTTVRRICDKVCVIEEGAVKAIVDLSNEEERKTLSKLMR